VSLGLVGEWEVTLNQEERKIAARSAGIWGLVAIWNEEETVWSRESDAEESHRTCCVTSDLVTLDVGPHRVDVLQELTCRWRFVPWLTLFLAVDGKEHTTQLPLTTVIINDRRNAFKLFAAGGLLLFFIAAMFELATGLHPVGHGILGLGIALSAVHCSWTGISWLLWSIKEDAGWPAGDQEAVLTAVERVANEQV